MSSSTQGWIARYKNLDNLIAVRVQVPLSRCKSNSITPTVATGHQSVKRGEKMVTGSLNWNPIEHESMDSASQDV
jgi:hypothetical protein